MKRFSRKWFAQIMIRKSLKQKLDSFKEIVRFETNANHPISYGDVVSFLIEKYEKPLRVVYPLSQKTLVGTKIKRGNLKVVTRLRRQTTSVISKLDGKTRVSFLLES